MDQDTEFTPETQSAPLTPHRGVVILVFGILGLVCCLIFGIVAWVMGNTDLAEMDAGTMDPEGRDLTQAGKICGIVSVILNVIGLLIAFVLLVLFIAGAVISS